MPLILQKPCKLATNPHLKESGIVNAMKRTKILFVITKSNFGGAQRYVYELAANLPKDAYDVTVACGGNGPLKTKLEGADIQTITIENFERDIRPGKELRSLKELWELYATVRPDVVHLNSSKAVVLGSLVGRIAGVPKIVSTIHGWPFLERRTLVWRALIWASSWLATLLSDNVILVSEHDRRHAHMPFARQKFSVIHTAVSEIPFTPRELTREHLFPPPVRTLHANDLWLVSIAELTPNKNLQSAIDAVADFNAQSDQKIFYSIIGGGEQEHELRAHIRNRGAEDHITLLGYVENARMHLKAFDLFLLPSHKEGLPYALLEAGAAGLPSIASSIGGIPEIIHNEENGLLINPEDHHSIVQALAKLTASPELLARLGTALKETVAHDFSFREMLTETEKVYRA